MKNLETGATMIEAGGFLTEQLSAASRIDAPRYRWNLAEIASIVTTDTLASAVARDAAVRQARTRRTLTGAVIGGAVDFTMGNDSILDGVLLGAAFGYLTSDSPQKITAKVGIIFNDGEALSLEVDATEYALLQTAAHRSLAKPAGGSNPSRTSYAVNLYDAEDVLGKRRHKDAIAIMIFAIGGGFFMGFASIILRAVLGMKGAEASLFDRIILTGVPYLIWPAIAMVVFGAIYAVFPFEKLESFLLDDAERQAFERLKKAASSKPALA